MIYVRQFNRSGSESFIATEITLKHRFTFENKNAVVKTAKYGLHFWAVDLKTY